MTEYEQKSLQLLAQIAKSMDAIQRDVRWFRVDRERQFEQSEEVMRQIPVPFRR